MDINNFKLISFNGRVCYAISCFENVIIELGCNVEDWKNILKYMWSFTSVQYLDEDWSDIIVEMIPENLLEFNSFEKHDLEYLTEEEFKNLYKLYTDLDSRIGELFSMIFDLGTSHAYTVIVGYGARSLNELSIIIDFMINNKFTLPDFNLFKQYSIEENRGWGNKFDSTSLSKIINN